MRKLLIIGHGGLGRCVKDIAFRMNVYDDIKYLDDNSDDKEVIGKVNDLNKYINDFDDVYVAFGNNTLRQEMMEKIVEDKLANIIDPSAFVSDGAKLSKGLLIYPGTVIESKATINKGNIISSNTVISHDAYIGRYNLIYANTTIRPKVKTDDLIKVGNNVVISDGKHVSENIGDLKVV